LFEACEKDKLLDSADYRALADWYLVTNRRSEYERTRLESFKQMPENMLEQMLYQGQERWNQSDSPLPSELDDDTLFAIRALFEKSAQPENYLYQLRNLYGSCRDFRLLQILPDAMLGRSTQQVYAFLKYKYLDSDVLEELRNEATADEILVRINALHGGERTTTDLRALDLLEALVERKSSEVLNEPGPHIESCLAAMQRAFQREWADGEPRMMAAFLYQLGALPDDKLKAEQLRELHELRTNALANSRDHLEITIDLCELMFNSYGEREAALQQMEIEVRDYSQANQGIWPWEDNEILSRYVTLLESANRYASGEQLLQKHIQKPANDEQIAWMKDRLMNLYIHALESDGAVSIGTGRTNLFEPLVALMLQELEVSPDENIRYNILSRLTTVLDIGHRYQVAGTVDAVRKLAFELLPELLKRQMQQYRNTATAPLHVFREVLGAKLCLQYVVERMEQYPKRLEIQYDNSWNAFGNELSSHRAEVGKSDLDDRVLKLATDRLRYYLLTRESNGLQMFHHGYEEFWVEKTAEFAAVAEGVLNEKRSSGRRAMSVALYLRQGLDMTPRAIEILHIAHADGLLDESEQSVLVSWLEQAGRYAEMIPILEPLVKQHPDAIGYRTSLMSAYFHAQRPEQLTSLIEQTDAHFHEGGRWTKNNVAQFAAGCLNVEQLARVKQYYTESIAIHQRSSA